MTGVVAVPRGDDAWIGYCRYDPRAGGCITHVYRSTGRLSLCGVLLGEDTGQTLAEAGTVSCKRCMKMVAQAHTQQTKF